jgi:hypothetical protein
LGIGWTGANRLSLVGCSHHAEGFVNPKVKAKETKKCLHRDVDDDDLVEKVLAKKTVTDFRYPRGPEHVDSENIKLKIGRRSSVYQLF